MPSPFPGMDPYLEAHWRDVHASLIIYARDALQGALTTAPTSQGTPERQPFEARDDVLRGGHARTVGPETTEAPVTPVARHAAKSGAQPP